MTRAKEAEPRWGLQSPFLFVPLLGHTPFSQSWPRTSVLGGLCAGGLLLGGSGQARCACSLKWSKVHAAAELPLLGGSGQALCACSCKWTEVHVYGAPVPHSLWAGQRRRSL